MSKVCERFAQVAVLVGVLGTLSSQAGAEIVGAVISTSGDAYAVRGDERRPLECGTPIEKGEHIVTQSGARVGFVANDTYVQLDSGSDVTVDQTAGGAAALSFNAGAGRVIDTRESGAPVEVSTPHASARGLGTDTEVAVTLSGTELCEGAAALDVHSASAQASPGECLTVPQAGTPSTSPRGEERIPPLGAVGCVDVAVVSGFTPDVSALGLGDTIAWAPFDPDRRTYNPCDNVGQACGQNFGPGGPGVLITEQNPVPRPRPGPGGGVN